MKNGLTVGLEWIKKRGENDPSRAFSYINYIDFLEPDKTVWEESKFISHEIYVFECWRLKVEIIFVSFMFHYILAIEGIGMF